ncbi:hypothetical protein H2509_00075 [Stappia sp. F7233]|uniref:Uncharacterized protein n=1 Tax=Stappia albiluteola TaxID=2758565 RepID=A0A839A8G9_9HYPH|nr:hypothetical protein [Stappia albiluteola]MBA5775516.1 hypothetical protein [Stappia albiluteola]
MKIVLVDLDQGIRTAPWIELQWNEESDVFRFRLQPSLSSVIGAIALIAAMMAAGAGGLIPAHGFADEILGQVVILADADNTGQPDTDKSHGAAFGHCLTGVNCMMAVQTASAALDIPKPARLSSTIVQRVMVPSRIYGFFRPPRRG